MDKVQQRKQAYAARQAQTDKDELSRRICSRFVAQPWYAAAKTVLWYVHCRSEVRTVQCLSQALAEGRQRIVVPYCTQDEEGRRQLGLWWLNSLDELQPGMWNILEPPRQRWQEAERMIAPAELDLVMVPGVAFDRQGGRLGNGAGYYDRLLGKLRADAVSVGVCYQSQLLPEVIMQAHDQRMDFVLTEQALFDCRQWQQR